MQRQDEFDAVIQFLPARQTQTQTQTQMQGQRQRQLQQRLLIHEAVG